MRRLPPSAPEDLQPVSTERLDALARRAMERVNPLDHVTVVFAGEPLRARFACVACDELLPPQRGGEYRCASCGFTLVAEQARRVVDHKRQLLDVLSPGGYAPSSVGLVRRFWRWIF